MIYYDQNILGSSGWAVLDLKSKKVKYFVKSDLKCPAQEPVWKFLPTGAYSSLSTVTDARFHMKIIENDCEEILIQNSGR